MRGYQGPPGIDGMTVRDFEQHLPRNLQRVWTQLRDGTYTPAPLRIVPPPGGRGRPLSVLTVSDMIAQMVIARKLEAEFSRRREIDRDRLNQRARVAPGRWKVEVDAHAVFTSCRHDLLLRVVESATDEEWLAGYVSRFLRASERQPDTTSGSRRLGTMPGSPLSTVLADLFLYYALDRWIMDHFPELKLFRELDSAVVHCQSEQQARSVRAAIWQRLDDVALKVDRADIGVDRATRGEQTEVFAMPPAGPAGTGAAGSPGRPGRGPGGQGPGPGGPRAPLGHPDHVVLAVLRAVVHARAVPVHPDRPDRRAGRRPGCCGPAGSPSRSPRSRSGTCCRGWPTSTAPTDCSAPSAASSATSHRRRPRPTRWSRSRARRSSISAPRTSCRC